jgi:hypothetical protein
MKETKCIIGFVMIALIIPFTSVKQLRQAIDDFIAAYNEDAAPFEWKKKVVKPVGFKRSYADLCR